MRASSLLPIAFFCVVLGGCSGLFASATRYGDHLQDKSAAKAVIKSPDTVLDELLTYSNYFNGLTATERTNECKHLLQTLEVEDNLFNRMRIVLALSVAPECGRPAEAVEFLKPILGDETGDLLSIWFADYQVALLERMQHQEELLRTLKADLKSATTRRLELERKLEALKSIEKSINERKGINEVDRK